MRTVVVAVAALAAVVAADSTDLTVAEAPASIVCVCRCCYMGECNAMANTSYVVDSCNDCVSSSCAAIIKSNAWRQKVARTFEALQDGVPDEARIGITYDVCEVVSVLEASTCTTADCKRTTDVKAECYDRQAVLHRTCIWLFTIVSIFGLLFAFVKNYIPALQMINQKYFDY